MPVSPQFWHIDPDDGGSFRNGTPIALIFHFATLSIREKSNAFGNKSTEFIVPLAVDAQLQGPNPRILRLVSSNHG